MPTKKLITAAFAAIAFLIIAGNQAKAAPFTEFPGDGTTTEWCDIKNNADSGPGSLRPRDPGRL